MSALITVDHVSHAFGTNRVLDGIDLAIEAGSYTVLLGPSGSGKTTLLSVLGGFLMPDQGRVLLAGEDITSMPPARRPTATVFQDYALFPHMTIAANVGFGLRMRGMKASERREKVQAALALVGLADLGARKPHQLSGGQRQRVALARALIIEPKALFLDEPLGALDLALRRQMQDELKSTQRRVGAAAFVHVTHDQEEAMALADQVVVMNAGRIEDAGPPERVYARPASRFTAAFMGESNVIEGRALDARDGRVQVETPLGRFDVAGSAAPAAPVALAIRPESLTIGAAGGDRLSLGEVRVEEVVFQGSFKRVRTRTVDGQTLLLKTTIDIVFSEGETISLHAREQDLILLSR
ncbi:MAG: ABC transporter ATP-binding protein [Alphaproteobacteria bacterium]